MKRKLLYYPYIDIPSKELIRKAILYWDKISTIVPYDYDFESHFNQEVRKLYYEGLYEPKLVSDLFLKKELFNDFENRIIRYFQKVSISEENKFSRIHRNKYRIHRNKHMYLFEDLFREKGLIIGEDGEWIYMPENVAHIYMSILAMYLAEGDQEYTIPVTDKKKFEKTAFNLTPLERRNSSRYSIGLQMLIENLPAPSTEVPIEKIIKFKEKRRYELLKFREFLDEQFYSIRNSEDEYELKEKLVKFRENLEKEIYEIKFLLDDYYIETMTFSAKTLLEFIHPTKALKNIVNLVLIPMKKKQLENRISKNELSYIYYGFQGNIFKK